MPYGLKDETVVRINGVLSRYPQVSTAVLYGSRAKGNFEKGSDIDLALDGDRLDLAVISKIANALDDLLLPYTIDLCNVRQIDNPDLIDHIRRIGIVFYRKAL
jgi:predicted nucleotidyltransferase